MALPTSDETFYVKIKFQQGNSNGRDCGFLLTVVIISAPCYKRKAREFIGRAQGERPESNRRPSGTGRMTYR